jgi:hypothetical protein
MQRNPNSKKQKQKGPRDWAWRLLSSGCLVRVLFFIVVVVYEDDDDGLYALLRLAISSLSLELCLHSALCCLLLFAKAEHKERTRMHHVHEGASFSLSDCRAQYSEAVA